VPPCLRGESSSSQDHSRLVEELANGPQGVAVFQDAVVVGVDDPPPEFRLPGVVVQRLAVAEADDLVVLAVNDQDRPGRHAVDQAGLKPLHEINPGGAVRLERLTEDLELDLDVMLFFERSGLMPGADIRVVAVAPDGTMTLEVEGEKVALGEHLSDNLWVRPRGR